MLGITLAQLVVSIAYAEFRVLDRDLRLGMQLSGQVYYTTLREPDFMLVTASMLHRQHIAFEGKLQVITSFTPRGKETNSTYV